ncbi:MAG: elongation factor G [Albidovulum sp.]
MRCITVLGPSQSGKSELVRALAALEPEPARSEAAGHMGLSCFDFMGDAWCAIEMPGGPEYARMAGGPLLAADAAVICVAPDPDEAVLAAPWLRAVEAAGTPCFIFINQMDAAKGRVRDIAAALQAYTDHTIVLRQIPIRESGKVVGAVDLISERAWRYREGQNSVLVEMPKNEADREHAARAELLEHMSDYDDALLEELIEDREPATGALFAIARRETQDRAVIPAFLGAASHKNGVMRLMKALRHEVPDVSALCARLGHKDAVAVGFHAQNRKHLGKCTYIRVLADGVAQGGQLGGGSLGGLVGIGGKAGMTQLGSGDVGLSVKSDQLNAGQVFSASAVMPAPSWCTGCPPALARIVVPEHERDEVRLSAALARLAEADPMLISEPDSETGHAVLRVQGPMHLREALAILKDGFGIDVRAEPVAPLYLETISAQIEEHYRHRKQSGGAGQFADVSITVRPAARGAGFSFDETVKGGAVPRNYIPSVEEGAREALDKGPLGFRATDVSVTLTDGKHHAVDSSDFAFRTAGRMALREAMRRAGPVLLQPIERVEVHVPSIHSGAIVSVVSSLKGQVLGFDRDPAFRGWDIFRALLPASTTEDLVMALGSATQGTAWHEAEFDHYEELYGREAERISKEHAA